MNICDEQYAKFGKTCKWLEYDDMMHACLCLKQIERLHTLQERFCELGFKHPDVAYDIVKTGCLENTTHMYECFDDNDKNDHMVWEAMECLELTETEKEAVEAAEAEFKSDEHVKSLYKMGKKMWLDKWKKAIESELQKISEYENDEDLS